MLSIHQNTDAVGNMNDFYYFPPLYSIFVRFMRKKVEVISLKEPGFS